MNPDLFRLYNPPEGRGKSSPVTQKDAMDELVAVVS